MLSTQRAEKPIGKILELITANAEKQHVEIYKKMSESFSFTQEEANEIDALWEEAKAACTDERALSEINRSEISWRYVKSSLKLSEFSSFFARAKENKQLYEDILAAGTTMFHEGSDDTTVQSCYEYEGAENWQAQTILTNAAYIFSVVFYIAAIIFAAFIFVQAIKSKKYIFCTYLPLLLAAVELALWNRRAFLAWVDIDQYVLTLVIAFFVIMFLLFVSNSLKYQKKSKNLIFSFIGTFIFFCLYEGPITIINVIMYNGGANDKSMSVSATLCALFVLALCFRTLKLMSKTLNKNKKTEE